MGSKYQDNLQVIVKGLGQIQAGLHLIQSGLGEIIRIQAETYLALKEQEEPYDLSAKREPPFTNNPRD